MRFMDVVKENKKKAGVTEEDSRDRVRLRQMIHCGSSSHTRSSRKTQSL